MIRLKNKVSVIGILFFILFAGNSSTLLLVLSEKWQGKLKLRYRLKALAAMLSHRFPTHRLGENKKQKIPKLEEKAE